MADSTIQRETAGTLAGHVADGNGHTQPAEDCRCAERDARFGDTSYADSHGGFESPEWLGERDDPRETGGTLAGHVADGNGHTQPAEDCRCAEDTERAR